MATRDPCDEKQDPLKSKVSTRKCFIPVKDSKRHIAMHHVRGRFAKLEPIMAKYNAKYLGVDTDELFASSHWCLEKMFEVMRNGSVTSRDVAEMDEMRGMAERIYKNFGALFFAKSKCLDSWSDSFSKDLLKCFLNLSPLAVSRSQRVNLSHMGLLLRAALRPSCNKYFEKMTSIGGDHAVCYAVTLRIRLAHPHDKTDMMKLAQVGLDAAQRTGFVPWIFLGLCNRLFLFAKLFGAVRLVHRVWPDFDTDDSSLVAAHTNTRRALQALNEFLPQVCDGGIHSFVGLLNDILAVELNCLRLSRPAVPCPRLPPCWHRDCEGPSRVYGDVMQRFEPGACLRVSKRVSVHDERPRWTRKCRFMTKQERLHCLGK